MIKPPLMIDMAEANPWLLHAEQGCAEHHVVMNASPFRSTRRVCVVSDTVFASIGNPSTAMRDTGTLLPPPVARQTFIRKQRRAHRNTTLKNGSGRSQ